MTDAPHVPQAVIDAWALDAASLERLTGGLINASFAVQRRSERCVLQRVNPVFPASVHDDIEAVTRHLEARGVTTPRLLPTGEGRLFLESGSEIWRLLTRIEGATHETVSSSMTREAGRVLGTFHAALIDFDAPLASARPPVHALDRHLEFLRRTVDAKQDHPAHAAVADLAERIAQAVAAMPAIPEMTPRLVHGDPKISNVVFAGERAVGLIDLDTITRHSVAFELGDAFRSWCNPEPEDSADARFSLERFEAALAGYAEAAGSMLDPATRQAVPVATIQIAIELAARFAADALNESYFGWDRDRFANAGEHNLMRAGAQFALAESMLEDLPAMRELAMTQP